MQYYNNTKTYQLQQKTMKRTHNDFSFFQYEEESFNDMFSNSLQNASLSKEDHLSQKRRSSKNKFINKIKQQMESGQISQIHTFPHTHPSEKVSSCLSSKKQQNKIAAQKARDRKKFYTKILQQHIEKLETQMEEVNRELSQAREQIFNRQMPQRSQGKQSRHQQIHIINKLDRLLSEEVSQDRDNEINICLDSIIYRNGALGKQRKTALNKLYLDLLNFSQPALYRYILWSAVGKKHLFGNGQVDEKQSWSNQINTIALEAVQAAHQNGDDLTKRGEEIANHCQHFTKSAQDLVKFRSLIEKKGQCLDNTFNEIREILTPEQIAQVILFIEKNAFKKEICLLQNDQINSRKKIKPNQES